MDSKPLIYCQGGPRSTGNCAAVESKQAFLELIKDIDEHYFEAVTNYFHDNYVIGIKRGKNQATLCSNTAVELLYKSCGRASKDYKLLRELE
jgi:hypothetical protein